MGLWLDEERGSKDDEEEGGEDMDDREWEYLIFFGGFTTSSAARFSYVNLERVRQRRLINKIALT